MSYISEERLLKIINYVFLWSQSIITQWFLVLNAQFKILLSKINTEALPQEVKRSGYLCFSVFLEFSEACSLSISFYPFFRLVK